MNKSPHSEITARDLKKFRSDIVDLFSKEKGGHIARWVYHDMDRGGHQPTGNQLWESFLKEHDGYYVLEEEISLINWHKKALCNTFAKADTILDIGSGEGVAVEKKAMPLVLGCPNVKIYAPIDLSSGLLADASAKAENMIIQAANDVAVEPLCIDFYHAVSNAKIPGKRRAGLFLGSTITNMYMRENDPFPRENIKKKIKKLAKLTKSNTTEPCTITFGYDANPDLEDAKAGYDHDRWKQLVVGIMFDVENILKPYGTFNPVGWKHETVINEDSHVLHQCVVATTTQDFFIGEDYFSIKEGDRFVIKNNFKYGYDTFGKMVEECGYELHEPIRHPSGRMLLQTIDI